MLNRLFKKACIKKFLWQLQKSSESYESFRKICFSIPFLLENGKIGSLIKSITFAINHF